MRETPNYSDQINSVHYDTSPVYSCVRTAAMFGMSARRGLSSASARPVCVCVCVCVCAIYKWYYRFYQFFLVGLVWPHWRPRVGSLPIIAGLRCRPGVHPCIAPRPVRYALGPEPGSLPQDHPGSGVVAPWLPLGQLHSNRSTSPSLPCHPVCCVCIGTFTAGGARGSQAASTAYSIWRFPPKGCTAATARLQTCPIRGSIPRPFGCETYA